VRQPCFPTQLLTSPHQVTNVHVGRYWLGEWICADCGYIYGSRGEQQPFETLGRCICPAVVHISQDHLFLLSIVSSAGGTSARSALAPAAASPRSSAARHAPDVTRPSIPRNPPRQFQGIRLIAQARPHRWLPARTAVLTIGRISALVLVSPYTSTRIVLDPLCVEARCG
jgi:hypothetical protein